LVHREIKPVRLWRSVRGAMQLGEAAAFDDVWERKTAAGEVLAVMGHNQSDGVPLLFVSREPPPAPVRNNAATVVRPAEGEG
jgi:hypothetical protein